MAKADRPIGLLGVVVTASLLAGCASATIDGAVQQPPADTPANGALLTSHLALRDDMRALWTAHVTLTRVYLMAAITNAPDVHEAAVRLTENQVDIGDAFRPFYGDVAADRLTELLRQHVAYGAQVIEASRDPFTPRLGATTVYWTESADAVARHLADLNPLWSYEELRIRMRAQLDATLVQSTGRFESDWALDADAYDRVVDGARTMGDVLAEGIEEQFPERVSASTISPLDEELHVTLRSLWAEHAAWMRIYLIARLADGPDAPFAYARLQRTELDLAGAVRPYYGDGIAHELVVLMSDHVERAAAFLEAQATRDGQSLATRHAEWSASTARIASFLATTNRDMSAKDLPELLAALRDSITAQAVARLNADWEADVDAYDAASESALGIADAMSAGISAAYDLALVPVFPVNDGEHTRL